MDQINDVVLRYLEDTGLSLRGFAAHLVQGVRAEISHAAVMTWRDGRSEPDTDLLCLCLTAYPEHDWRFSFALECLAAKAPEVWGTNGGIWKVAKRLNGHGA